MKWFWNGWRKLKKRMGNQMTNNMQNNDFLYLTKEEKTMLSLRSLYKHSGYASFKMSQFEESDLYVKNKEFLIGDSVLTFTDTDGKPAVVFFEATEQMLKAMKYYNSKALVMTKTLR